MPAIDLILDGHGAFADVPPERLAHSTEPLRLTALAGAMRSGAASVGIGVFLPNGGGCALGETSLALFLSAADVLRARFGPDEAELDAARRAVAVASDERTPYARVEVRHLRTLLGAIGAQRRAAAFAEGFDPAPGAGQRIRLTGGQLDALADLGAFLDEAKLSAGQALRLGTIAGRLAVAAPPVGGQHG